MGIRVKTLIAFVGLVFASTIIASAQSPGQRFAALGSSVKSTDRLYTPIPKADDPARLAFCGQCSADDHCGSGHKCCGPSTCRQCFQVTVCAK